MDSFISSETKFVDIRLSAFIACHAFINSVDHLSNTLKHISNNTEKNIFEKIRLHRTKCSSIILNVIHHALEKKRLSEIGDQSYSLILDESIDVGNSKYMAYCTRYFNQRLEKIVVDFIGFQSVFRATAIDLYDAFLSFISKFGLKLDNLIGIGTGGANNLCGLKHSFFTLLKEKVPNLQLLKCVCHSLNKCSSKASEELPNSLEFLIRESRNWICHSPLRKQLYENLYASLNNESLPLKLAQLCGTRWLAYYAAVKSTLEQWTSLKSVYYSSCIKNPR